MPRGRGAAHQTGSARPAFATLLTVESYALPYISRDLCDQANTVSKYRSSRLELWQRIETIDGVKRWFEERVTRSIGLLNIDVSACTISRSVGKQ